MSEDDEVPTELPGSTGRSEIYSDKSWTLAEGTEVARLRRRFSFVSQEAFAPDSLVRKAPCLCTHRTEGVTRSEGREGANGDGSGDRAEYGHHM